MSTTTTKASATPALRPVEDIGEVGARRRRSVVRAIRAELGLLVVAALALTAVSLTGGVLSNGVGGLAAVLLAFATIPALMSLTLWLDRFEPEPPWLLVRLFLWGAGISYCVAAWVNPILADLVGEHRTSVYGAPILEELLKGAGIIWVLWRRRSDVSGRLDGVVYALMVGLGFAVVENIEYYLAAFEQHGVGRLLELWMLRSLLTPLLHPFVTVFIGLAAGYVAVNHFSKARSVATVAAGLVAAMVVHGVWNHYGMQVYVFLGIPAFAVAAWLVWSALRQQSTMLSHHLTPEVDAGLMREQDLQTLLTTQGRVRDAVDELDNHSKLGAASQQYRSVAYALAAHRERLAHARTAGAEPTVAQLERDAALRGQLWLLHPEHAGAHALPAAPGFIAAAAPVAPAPVLT